MIIKSYSIYDKVAGVYGQPIFASNDDVAKRDFAYFCQSDKVSYMSADLQLYFVGAFNTETGEFIGVAKPDFIAAGMILSGGDNVGEA